MSSILDNILVNVSTSVYVNQYGEIMGSKGDVEKLLNASAQQILDKPLDSFIDAHYAHITSSAIEHCLHTGENKTVWVRLRHEEQERELLFLPKDISAVNWPEGAVVKFFDVTYFSEQTSTADLPVDVFNTMLRDFESGTVLLRENGIIENMNAQAASIIGCRRAELLGQSIDDVIRDTSESAPALLVEIANAWRNTNRPSQSTIKTDEGETVFLKYYPISGEKDQQQRLVVTLQSFSGSDRGTQKVGRVYEKLLHKIQVMSIHNSLANDFNICIDGPQLYPRITRTLTIGLGIHDTVSTLCLRNKTNDRFELTSCFGIEPSDARSLMVKPLGIAQHVFLPVRLHPNGENLLRQGFTKMIYAPIVIGKQTVGYLSVFRKSENYQLHEEETLVRIIAEHLRQFIMRWQAEQELNEKVETLSRLRSISDAYQLAESKDQLAYTFISSITAEQGLRFNRAFLFLYNEEKEELVATVAIGPLNPEEAGETWQELSRAAISFDELLQDFDRIDKIKNSPLQKRFEKYSFKCTGKTFICKSIQSDSTRIHRKSEIDNETDSEFFHSLIADEFLIAPLLTKSKPVGVLVADNLITHEPISSDLLRYVEIICNGTQQALERMRLYEKLQESVDKLRRSNQLLQDHRNRMQTMERLSAIGEMAAVVAHEIRNPLVTIGGFAKTLSDDLKPDNPDQRYVKIIFDEVQRLERVVKDLLDFAKPIKMNRREVYIRDVISQAIDIVQPEMDQAGITVRSRLLRSTAPVLVDPDLIRQVLLNLMSNAMDAMREGGTLRISSRVNDDLIRIRVSDTGHGIEQNDIEKMFEPFFTRKTGGTGLGLAIVKNIVNQHAGTIKVESTKGAGTSFLISLPVDVEKDLEERAKLKPPRIGIGN
jgi:PAS domain S-box-containing protein